MIDYAGPSPEQVKRQRAFAQSLMQQGMDSTPVSSPLQGLARMLTAGIGGYFAGKADDAEKQGQARSAQAIAEMLGAQDGGGTQTVTAPKPDAAMPPETPAPAPKVSAPQPMAQVPEIYRPHIEDAAAAYNVNPTTLANMLMAESGGRVNATSPAGAQGIMQFMPATAKQYGVDVTDPKSSIDGAAHYLSDLMKQFGGDERKAVAAYNAGPGRVQAAGGDLSKLPAETQAYVPKVLGAAPSPAPVQVAQANTGTMTDAAPAAANPGLAAGLAPQPAQANGQAALIARMLQDPWTRDMGMQLAMSGIKSKQETAAQLQKLIAERQLDLAYKPQTEAAIEAAKTPAINARKQYEYDNALREVAPGGMIIRPGGSGGQPQVVAMSPNPAPGTQQGRLQAGVGEQQSKAIETWHNDALSAAAQNQSIGLLRQQIADGLKTGAGFDARAAISNVLQTVGADPEKIAGLMDPAKAALFKKGVGEILMDRAKAFGANPSDAEGRRLEQSLVNANDPTQAVLTFMDWLEAKNASKIQKFDEGYRAYTEQGADPLQFDLDWTKKHGAVPAPQPPQPRPQAQGNPPPAKPDLAAVEAELRRRGVLK